MKNNCQVRNFIKIFIEYIEKFVDHLDTLKFDCIVEFLIGSAAFDTVNVTKSAISKLIPRLNSNQRKNLLKCYNKFLTTEFCLISDEIIGENFLKSKIVSDFFNEYIDLFYKIVITKEILNVSFAGISPILMFASKLQTNLPDESYKKLLKCAAKVHDSDFLKADTADPFFNALGLIVKKLLTIDPTTKLMKSVINLILSKNIISILDSNALNLSYMKILLACNVDSENYSYLKEKISSLPSDSASNNCVNFQQLYLPILFKHQIVKKSILNLYALSADSDENEFKISTSSINNLVSIYSEFPDIIKTIPDLNGFFLNIINCVFNQIVHVNQDHDFFHSAFHIYLSVAFLLYYIFPNFRNIAVPLISYGIGCLLRRNELNGEEYPVEFVKRVIPHIDDMIKIKSDNDFVYFTENVADLDNKFETEKFIYPLKFVFLHPSADFVQSYMKNYFKNLFRDVPVGNKIYLYLFLNDFEIPASDQIAKAGFLYYLHDQTVKQGCLTDLVHFKEYFDLLKKSKCLCKTEEFVISKILNDQNN